MAVSERRSNRLLDSEAGLAAAMFGILAIIVLKRSVTQNNKKPPPGASRRNASPATLAAETDDRGRNARSPSEISVKGWKDILLRVYVNIGEHRILSLAAGVTYYSILAIFPALAALVAIYGLFSDPVGIAKHLDELSGVVPSGAIDVAREQLTRLSSKSYQSLGFTFVIALSVSLWSANAAMKSMFDTLNIIYGEQEKRGYIKLNAISLTFTIASIAFILAALGGVVVVPIILNYLWLSDAADFLVRIMRWPAMFTGLALVLACMYRFGPSRQTPRWKWISWGSAIATLAWLWISAILILLGAELNAEMEHQTTFDTTTGKPKPMGIRGARMADTLGAPQSS